MPEFIAPQDGAEKQDCERNAAKRWLVAHAKRLMDLRPIYLGDDLFACQPIADAITAAGGDFLLTAVVRPDSETTDCAVQAAKGRLASWCSASLRCSARIWLGVR
jgi:hypothetical protein